MAIRPDYLPTGTLTSIGRVVALFSGLDATVNRAVWTLLDVDPAVGSCVTQTIRNFSDRVLLMTALAGLRYPADSERLKDISENVLVANDDRNRLIHDEIVFSSIPDQLIAVARHKPARGKHDLYTYDLPTLRDLAKRLRALRQILDHLRHDHPGWRDAPLPSLDRSPTQALKLAAQMPARTQYKRGARRRS